MVGEGPLDILVGTSSAEVTVVGRVTLVPGGPAGKAFDGAATLVGE